MSMLFKRIKDWAVSITSFRTGDVLPVDGPSGTAKIGHSDLAKEVIKDSAKNTAATESDLVSGSKIPIMTAGGPKALPGNTIAKASEQTALTTYAQNVAHSIAPEFDPTRDSEHAYPAGYSVTYTDGKVYTFTAPHYGAWTGTDVEEVNLSNAFQVVNITAAGVYSDDLDNFPAQKCFLCKNSSVAESYAHKPAEQAFQLYCFGHTDYTNAKTQICVLADNTIYMRSKWLSWTSWKKIDQELLEVLQYAQSESYPAGRLARINNNVRMALADIASNAQYDATKWEVFTKGVLDNALLFVDYSVVADLFGNDLDNYPAGRIFRCVSSAVGATISHRPDNASDQFMIITIGHTDNPNGHIRMQIFAGSDGKTYIRNRWSSWSAWILVRNELKSILDFDDGNSYSAGEVLRYKDEARMALKDIAAGTSSNSDWFSFAKGFLNSAALFVNYNLTASSFGGDLNNYPANRMFKNNNNTVGEAVLNKPTGSHNQFMIYTFGNTESAYYRLQVFVDANLNVWIRSKWAYWSDWNKVPGDYDVNNSANVLAAFDNVVCVGDSLTWSQVYTGNQTENYRQAYNPYPKVVKKLCGMDSYQIIGYSGASSKGVWNSSNTQMVEKDNALCIIFLGTNQGLTDTLATDAPVAESDYTQWANTNTGCYAKWVAKALGLGYRVLLVKPFTVAHSEDSDLETTLSVIEQVATRFGVAVMTAPRTTANKYHYWPNGNGTNTLHYNDLGYAWFASALIHDVGQLPDATLKLIVPQ